MGLVHTDIMLKNTADTTKAECGIITEKEVRSVTVDALVDMPPDGAGGSILERPVLYLQGARDTWNEGSASGRYTAGRHGFSRPPGEK
jgi:hypothetical protein